VIISGLSQGKRERDSQKQSYHGDIKSKKNNYYPRGRTQICAVHRNKTHVIV